MTEIPITFALFWGEVPLLESMVREFNRQQQGQIQVNLQPYPLAGFLDRLRRMFKGTGRRVDVIGGDTPWTAELAASGWIADLSSRFPQSERRQFVPKTIEANTYQDKFYGVPGFGDVQLLYYRKDLLEQSGFSRPPQTWDELKRIALRVKQDSGLQYGFVFQGAQYDGGVWSGLQFIWSEGGDAFDNSLNPSRVIIDSPQAVAGLATERSMIAEGVSPPIVAEFDDFGSWNAFYNEEAVFGAFWPWFYKSIGGASSPLSRQQVQVAPIPGGEGCVGGRNLFINAASDAASQDAAWKFIQFLTSDNTQQERAVNEVWLPTREAVYRRPEVQQVPIIPTAKAALDNARARPTHRYYSEMSAAMAEQFNLCLKGQVTPAQATRTLQTGLSGILGRP
jgi:multiple sugar transport system substrate-binding protein